MFYERSRSLTFAAVRCSSTDLAFWHCICDVDAFILDIEFCSHDWAGVREAGYLCEVIVDYARKFIEAGIETELDVHPGVSHGYESVAPNTDVVKTTEENRLENLAKHVKPRKQVFGRNCSGRLDIANCEGMLTRLISLPSILTLSLRKWQVRHISVLID